MFIRTQPTKEQNLNRKIKSLKGKNTSEKFELLLANVIELLIKIKSLSKFSNKEIHNKIKNIVNQYSDNLETTSNKSVLKNMIYCSEDLQILFEDMTYEIDSATFDYRLTDCIDFISNFSSKSYIQKIEIYKGNPTKVQNQLKSIIREIRYQIGKQNYQVSEVKKNIVSLENINISIANKLNNLSQNSFEYRVSAEDIQSNDNAITVAATKIIPIQKNIESLKLIVNLFESLLIQDENLDNLKDNGYIRKLIRKLYKHPEKLNVIENSLDITEALISVRDEINSISELAKPLNKNAFEDTSDPINDSTIDKYKSMSKEEN